MTANSSFEIADPNECRCLTSAQADCLQRFHPRPLRLSGSRWRAGGKCWKKIFTPLNPVGNPQHNLTIEFGIGYMKASYLLRHHLTGAVHPWPRPSLKALRLYTHKAEACRADIMLTSRRARAGQLILSPLRLPLASQPRASSFQLSLL